VKNLEKFKKSNLRNLSNNLYSYLKENSSDKRIKINETFDFDDYKESVRFELVQFSYNFISLVNLKADDLKETVIQKARLKNYVDEILDNEKTLENFTIYKIQLFINRVARDLLENGYENFIKESKDEKYLKYKDIEIDTSRIIGFISADKVISELYREFNLKRLKPDEYSEAFLSKSNESLMNNPDNVDEINKILFKAATDIDEKNRLMIKHPVKDDETILRYIEEGCVAERTPKRVLKKVIEEEDIDFLS